MKQSIAVNDLCKRFQIGRLHNSDLMQEKLLNWIKHPMRNSATQERDRMFWALQNVSFTAEKGEVIGIIGRNGAGKSTLLKLLSKIIHPTSGSIKVDGRLASLLEVGTGFHGELTGRDNIFLNGSILGMKKKEIEKKLDAIVAFAGVETFLDTPVKRYSSGMFLRLGFAVAAHLEPDVLLVDEVLAVGDTEFQKKCLDTMDDLRRGGRTVLFVSHNMAAVENLCSRALWIDNGQIRMDGPAKSVIAAYMAINTEVNCLAADLDKVQNRRGNGDIRFTRVEFLGPDAHSLQFISSADPLVLRLHYHALKPIRRPDFEIGIFTDLGTLVTKFSTWIDYQIPSISGGGGHIDLAIDCFNFLPGRYFLSLWLKTQGPIYYDVLEHCLQFEVGASDFYGSGRGIHRYFGIVFLPCRWMLNGSTPGSKSIEHSRLRLPN